MNELFTQFINLLGAVLLLLAFAMISQRRILSLIHLFTLQGATLVVSTAVVGYVTQQPHLYVSAAITFALKVVLIPLLLHRVIARLDVRWDLETLINIPTTMLIGIGLVIFAFNLAMPVAQFSSSVARGSLGIALADRPGGRPVDLRHEEAAQHRAGSGRRGQGLQGRDEDVRGNRDRGQGSRGDRAEDHGHDDRGRGQEGQGGLTYGRGRGAAA
jgi:hypothetical protein